MEDFCTCLMDSGLIPVPTRGAVYTWHNCNDGQRSLWKKLDHMFVNDRWYVTWPKSICLNTTPRTSDHSPLVLCGYSSRRTRSLFWFDNYLATLPGFLDSVKGVWQHAIHGTPMYSITRKLKALKPVFREQRRGKGDLSKNVAEAKEFLKTAQQLLDLDYCNELLLLLERVARIVILKATKLEQIMLQQWAKVQWLKGGDQCTKIFFRKIAVRRASQKIFRINSTTGHTIVEEAGVATEFVKFFEDLLGGKRCADTINIMYLRPWARHIVTQEEGDAMIRPVDRVEIKEACLTFMKTKHLTLMWADERSVTLFRDGLSLFADWSGLRANITKSQLILSKSALDARPRLLSILAFQEGCILVRYLGLPMILSHLTTVDCKPLLQKLDERLKGWSTVQLSYAARIQLLQAVIFAMNIYWAMAFILPKSIIRTVEARMRKFLWQGGSGTGMAKVAWTDICKPNNEGEQGIRALEPLNRGLMSKHLWDVIQHTNTSIWVEWIHCYRLKRSTVWTTSSKTGSWSWQKNVWLRDQLLGNVTYQIGDGVSFLVWHDPWHPLGPLIHRFPRGPETVGYHLMHDLAKSFVMVIGTGL
ncbi:UNVERIFIED_CONTAM: putative ribonuclease H protein [Sesamum latifolium]|uniref:Ribonuclease H protein n=1 Tax=Sesamum latifolium TaxID=2727402 RepID=A0AAW2U4C2_9LAMI